MVPTSKPPVEAWGTAVCASARLTDRNMRRCTAEPSELSRICHCVPDPACAWPFVAASVIACLTAVPSRPSASTLTSCLTEAPGRIGVGSIVCVTPSANFPKHAVARRPAVARSQSRRYIGRIVAAEPSGGVWKACLGRFGLRRDLFERAAPGFLAEYGHGRRRDQKQRHKERECAVDCDRGHE